MAATVQPYTPIGRSRLGGLMSRANLAGDRDAAAGYAADITCERVLDMVQHGNLRPEHVAAIRVALDGVVA